ncbi:hypothetical protein D9M69_593040 [compost metagenome]
MRCGPATKSRSPASAFTAPMSLASMPKSVFAAIFCIALTSEPDSSSTMVESTAVLPASRSNCATSSQSDRRSSWRREQVTSPR